MRTAQLAFDEVGDPTSARAELERTSKITRRPQSRRQRVAWAASQIAAHAGDAARAYRALRELCAALYEPVAGVAAPRGAPAPEVALTLAPDALLDALAPAPRVLAREIATAAKLDARALLADPATARRVLGIRALTPAAAGRIARDVAAAIAADADPGVRAEALRLAVEAPERVRTAIVDALRFFVAPTAPRSAQHCGDAIERSGSAGPRSNAQRCGVTIDALRVLRAPLDLTDATDLLRDPAPAVRAAAARAITAAPAELRDALIAALSDLDREVRIAALGALSRSPALQTPALVAPLCAILERDAPDRDDTRAAIYILAKLRVDPAVVPALQAAVRGPRSDVATAAAMVLRELGADVPDLPLAERIERAAGELEGRTRDAIESGINEARRLGPEASPLVAALRRVANDHAMAREILAGLGADPGEPTGWLEPDRGSAPVQPERHGAYVIARLSAGQDTPTGQPREAMGLWDGATGKKLFVVDAAALFELVPGRAEAAVVRIELGGTHPWSFERFQVPSGERLASVAIPEALAYGTPGQLALAGGLATIWCDDRAAPYRFHIKLGDPDRLLDDTPTLGRRSSRRS